MNNRGKGGNSPTMLDGINIVISTVCREENYLQTTLDGLLVEYPARNERPICLVVGSPVTDHIECCRLLSGIHITEMGPNTWAWIQNNIVLHRATWNYYRCLTHPIAGKRGTLVFEDDIRFATGWLARLEATLTILEKRYGSDFVLVLYSAWFSALKEKHCNRPYVEYPYNQFYGTQGIYYPAQMRQSFARYLKTHGVVGNKNHYDLLLREFLIQHNIPLFATSPCLIQHIGKTSAIETPWHESADFMEDVTALPLEQAA